MSTARTLHEEAMAIASKAFLAQRDGEVASYSKLTKQAFFKEKEAAQFLFSKIHAEPTRSILYRSAAQLAYECGEFKEAEKLVSAALIGNPPIEILTELRSLNRQISDALQLFKNIEKIETSHEYINILRSKALHIKVKPKTIKFASAILIDNVISVLKNVKESFLNYIEINFRKSFDLNEFSDPEKLIKTLKSEANPLLVNLEYQSFTASISSDAVIMAKQYAPAIGNWKRNLFERYKQEVFFHNYQSLEQSKSITENYNENQRRKIYKPVIDLFQDSNSFEFSLTDSSYSEIRKTFQPVSKPIKDVLTPKRKPKKEIKDFELFQTIGLAKPEMGGSIPKSGVISSQVLESAEFNYSMQDIKYEKDYLTLKDEISFTIKYDKPVFSIDFEPLKISLQEYSFQDLIANFSRTFLNTYDKIIGTPVQDLNADEIEVKSYLENIVFARSK